jgi:hypothetical protein
MKAISALSIIVSGLTVGCGSDADLPAGNAAGPYYVLSGTLNHACHPLIDVRELLTHEQIRNLRAAENFSPPVMNNEDQVTDPLTGQGLGRTRYSVTTHIGGNVQHMTNHAGVDYDESHGHLNSDGQVRQDARYPVRAVADGVVLYAGLVCRDDYVSRFPESPLRPYVQWGIAIRILHRRINTAGASEYYLSVYAHLEGSSDPARARDLLAVRPGDYVTGRQVIATIGPTPELCADIPWATHLHHELRRVYPFSNDDVHRRVLNEQGTGYGGTPGRNYHIDPLAFYAAYGYAPVSGELVTSYPVGTVAYRVRWDKCHRTVDGECISSSVNPLPRDYYLVCAANTLCHITDEKAFVRRRFFQGSGDPWSYAVELSGAAFNCMRSGPAITDSGLSLQAVACPDGDYVAFVDGTDGYRRRVNFERSQAMHRILLNSWGFHVGDLVPNSPYCMLPYGEPRNLLLRDGSVVEAASDSDFYVISNGGHAYRLRRETFMKMGYPFQMVMQIPDGALPSLSAFLTPPYLSTPEFTFSEAQRCSVQGGGSAAGQPAHCGDSQCGGGEDCQSCPTDCGQCPAYCGDGTCDTYEAAGSCPADCGGSDTCTQSARRCWDSATYQVCLRDYTYGGTAWESFGCPSGTACNGGNCRSVALSPEAEPPPVPKPMTGPPTLTCTRLPDSRLRLTVSGQVANGLVDPLTTSLTHLVVGGNYGVAGWPTAPYQATDGPQPQATWSDTAPMILDLPADADELNLAAVLPDGSLNWFCIGSCGSAWAVSGECHVSGTLIRAGQTPPAPSPPTAVDHAVSCTATSTALVVDVTGPILDRLSDSRLQGAPVGLFVGCNNCGGWSYPYTAADARPQATWVGDAAAYRLTLPAHADGFNLFLADALGNLAWFDLETDVDSATWNVTRDCRRDGTLIVRQP